MMLILQKLSTTQLQTKFKIAQASLSPKEEILSTLLELKNIGLTYQTLKSETEAIKNINFSVDSGEFISIVGPSGCGKTTLLNVMGGLDGVDSGEIFLFDKKVLTLHPNL